jgi:hypothetical protein
MTLRANRNAVNPPTLLNKTLGSLSKRFRVVNTMSRCRHRPKVCAELAEKLKTPPTGTAGADESDDVRFKLFCCGTSRSGERHNI